MKTLNAVPCQKEAEDNAFTPVPAVYRIKPYQVPKLKGCELVLDGTAGMLFREIADDRMSCDPAFYPDKSKLEREIASRLGLKCEQVLLTAGADNAIETALKISLCAGRDFILPVPTFDMIERYALFTGCAIRKVNWENGDFPFIEVLQAATERCAAIMVVSPNNPTGLTAAPETVTKLARAVPQALIVADLAYVEFASEDPTLKLLAEPNIVVIRTFSKAWGMAGLRLGYALGSAKIIDWMSRALSPYPASSLSLNVAERWIYDARPLLIKKIEKVKGERMRLEEIFAGFGISVLPSQANFVLAITTRAAAIYDNLARRGVKVRSWSSDSPLANCLRISCPGNDEDFEKLCTALNASMEAL